MIALSCGTKLSPVGSLDLSQSTRVTDGRTDGQTDRQNYESQDRASTAASRGKNVRDCTVNVRRLEMNTGETNSSSALSILQPSSGGIGLYSSPALLKEL